MKKKIGIMGGTFNPIHYGHLILAERARESFSLDYVIFIPSGLSYMKDDVLDSNIRYQMTALAIKDNPNFKISAIETNRIGNSYTYETLEELSLLEKEGSTFYFIIGEDSLFNIEQWKFPERIFQLAEIIVAKRMESSHNKMEAQKEKLEKKFHAIIHFLQSSTIEISSTEIRERIINNKSVQYLLPDEVIAFIQEQNLYRTFDRSESQ